MQGSEAGKAISYYVLDAFISIDHDAFFLNQIQSRGLLRSILLDISSSSLKVLLFFFPLNYNHFFFILCSFLELFCQRTLVR